MVIIQLYYKDNTWQDNLTDGKCFCTWLAYLVFCVLKGYILVY